MIRVLSLVYVAAIILSACAVGKPRPMCENPGECAPPHHSPQPSPNIAKPYKGQMIRAFPK